jgi:hypothetical protein
MMPVEAHDPVIVTVLETLGATVEAGFDPVPLAVEMPGDVLSPGAQVIGKVPVAEEFGPVGLAVETSLDAVGLMVEPGVDAIALALEAVGDPFPLVLAMGGVVCGQCGGCNGQGQGDDCQYPLHGFPPRPVGR